MDWRNDLLWDFVAAIGVSCMLIPQALSYALLAGVPPAMGLFTAWVLGQLPSWRLTLYSPL